MKKIKLGKGWINFVIVGVVAYLYFLVSGFPASAAYKYFVQPADRGRVVNLQGLSGTVWSGMAAEARIANISLGSLQWDLQLLTLLTGKLGLEVVISNDAGTVATELAAGLDGQLALSDVKGEIPIQAFMPLLYGMPIALAGQINADIKRAEIKQGEKLVVDGKVVWRNAALTAPQPFEFGDLVMAFRPQDDGSKILLADQGGPLSIEGTVQVKNSGEYKVNVYLGSRGDNENLQNALKMMGRTNPNGKILISRTGHLPNWK